MKITVFLTRLRHRLWSTSTALLLVRPAGTVVTIPEEKRCPGELREVTEENIMDCAAFEDAALYVPIYRSMLEKGDIIHFGYLNGRCVFRRCMQLHGTFDFDGCAVRSLKENEAYTHFSYCAPEGRGNHFQLASLSNMYETHPMVRGYTIIKEDNIPSLKNCYRAGYEPYSLLTVKNRLFHRALTEQVLSPEEQLRYRV